MPKKDSTYSRIERALFKDKGEASDILSAREMEIKNRMMLCVSKKMDDPLIEDADLVNFLMHGCAGNAEPVSKSQAYRDIGMINRLVGNIQLAAKAWYRYMIVEGGKKAFKIAIDKGDAKGAAASLDKIGKYTRSDKEDEKFDYSQLIPPSFEPSDDVTLLEGLEVIEDLEEKRKELRNRFKGLISSKAEDIKPIEEKEEDEE
ncbi:hypothetical protein IX307_001171 [Bacteroides pyogenes]|uniref:Uncharacterized protein n=1 Tax=Bacteroides pyogenes TaxID=310300 RepID=A0A5D3E8D9_9BACE|nr:hypothetical protein [Bacteroides pyogenes]MBR8719942.1 hypothetical protein [Bacteroides pyogenes]MBR8786857.1 hypothetical protein [Bacteroides pyogenes]MBR8792342.1 hypothetical protein [Bacteroides pyogenes]TYK32397.1 hypothetical protein FNJ60_12285 [Bacteroides pyogenes]